MAFQGLTPESLLDRSDSKNPATTCKGLTANGRPCRRGLGSTPGSSPNNTPTRRSSSNNVVNNDADNAGVVAIIDSTNAAAFFCWQHKDQAQNLIARIESQQLQQAQQHRGLQRQKTRIIPLQKRSSIDTLIERVGIIDLDGDVKDQQNHSGRFQPSAHQDRLNRPENVRIRKRETLPVEWQGIQGPLMSVPEEVVHEVAPDPRIQRRRSRSRSRTRLSPRESRQEKLEYSSAKVRPKQQANWSCCGLVDDGYNDDGPPVRRRERYEQQRPSRSHSRPRPSLSASRPASYSTNVTPRPVTQAAMQERPFYAPQTYNNGAQPIRQQQQQRQSPQPLQAQVTPTRQRPVPNPLPSQNTSPFSSTPPHSQTTHFLSLIPPHLDPTTTSALLSELSKPFAKDDDAGYIYIYWLTPSSSSSPNNPQIESEDKPDDDLASTILDSDSDSDSDLESTASYRPTNHRRNSSKANIKHSHAHSRRRKEALRRYASIKNASNPSSTLASSSTSPPKILLKIGRATNVHRRMTQWSKQCGQNITLVRYYPYHSQSSPSTSSSPQVSGKKVPHVNRVERLIHIELRGTGLAYDSGGEKCGVCGRGHREWFEVGASREGLKGVDEVVRRWVGWGERMGQTG